MCLSHPCAACESVTSSVFTSPCVCVFEFYLPFLFVSPSLFFIPCLSCLSCASMCDLPNPSCLSSLPPSLRVSSPLTVSMFPCLFVSPPYVSPDCLVPMYVPSFWPWCLSLCFILTVYRPVFSVFRFAFPISYAYSFQLCSHAFPLSLFSLSVYILSLSPSVPCRCIRLHSLMSPWYFQVFNSI